MKTTFMRPVLRLVLGVSAIPSVIVPAHALQLRVLSPSAHLRMIDFPSSPSTNLSFLNPGGSAATRLDLSGVGWSVQGNSKQFTLVSPRHFLGANHFRPAIGSQVRFLASDNSLHTLTVSGISSIPNANGSQSDVFLGEFTTEMPATAQILPLPYLNLASEAAYVGKPLVVVGQAARGGRGVIGSVLDFGDDPITGGAAIQTRAFSFTYATAGSVDDAYAEGGDSGSPSFTVESGKAALVGTHTAIASAFGSTTTFDTLVPHYVPELNVRMEATGLRMRKINPPATSLTVTGSSITTNPRVAHPFVFRIQVTNGSAVADNVTADVDVPPGFAISSITAPDWFATGPSSLRRGGLHASQALTFDLHLTSTAPPGVATIIVHLKSDGSAAQSFAPSLTLLPSFAGWAAGLYDPSHAGDSDGDGISNLIEYATGGDNRATSRFLAETPEFLMPQLSADAQNLTFLRRSDFANRALTYLLETSQTLEPDSWHPLEPTSLQVVATPAPGIEKIAAVLPAKATARGFYRLRIDLNE